MKMISLNNGMHLFTVNRSALNCMNVFMIFKFLTVNLVFWQKAEESGFMHVPDSQSHNCCKLKPKTNKLIAHFYTVIQRMPITLRLPGNAYVWIKSQL